MLNARNGRLPLEGGHVDFLRFGTGPRALILLPGVGDGLKTVRGMALPMALMYRGLAKDFTVSVFSRREPLSDGATTADMADDLAAAMDALGIASARVAGVSMGGMIAQQLALRHPERVEKLVLAVTSARPNPTLLSALGQWMEMAERGDYAGIMASTAELSYTEARLKKMRPLYGVLGRVGRPRSFRRFLIQAAACASHDCWDALPGIACPTLVIGAENDRVVSGEASRELAERIPGCKLIMYQGLSHGAYEEAPDFCKRLADFCR